GGPPPGPPPPGMMPPPGPGMMPPHPPGPPMGPRPGAPQGPRPGQVRQAGIPTPNHNVQATPLAGTTNPAMAARLNIPNPARPPAPFQNAPVVAGQIPLK